MDFITRLRVTVHSQRSLRVFFTTIPAKKTMKSKNVSGKIQRAKTQAWDTVCDPWPGDIQKGIVRALCTLPCPCGLLPMTPVTPVSVPPPRMTPQSPHCTASWEISENRTWRPWTFSCKIRIGANLHWQKFKQLMYFSKYHQKSKKSKINMSQ